MRAGLRRVFRVALSHSSARKIIAIALIAAQVASENHSRVHSVLLRRVHEATVASHDVAVPTRTIRNVMLGSCFLNDISMFDGRNGNPRQKAAWLVLISSPVHVCKPAIVIVDVSVSSRTIDVVHHICHLVGE